MGPSQVDTQASPQQKKGPALSVVKSSNPASVPQADCYCSAPPTPAFLPPVTQRGGQGRPARPPPASPPPAARGWVGVRCTFWHQSLAACASSGHLEHSFWNSPCASCNFPLVQRQPSVLEQKGQGKGVVSATWTLSI